MFRKKSDAKIDFKEECLLKQNFYYSMLGDRIWETYESDEIIYFFLKLGLIIFGPPKDIDENNIGFDMFYKDPIQKEKIEKLIEIVRKKCNSKIISVAFLFIVGEMSEGCLSEFPVLRILTGQDEQGYDICNFVDIHGCVYFTWEDFLKNNKIPALIYCYPKNGFYFLNSAGDVDIDYGVPPSRFFKSRVKQFVDGATTLLGVGTLAASCVMPLSGPVVTISLICDLWSISRAGNELLDRHSHEQSIGLRDSESRAQWLSLLGAVFGSASMGTLKYTHFIASRGRTLSNIPAFAVNAFKIGDIGLSGCAIMNQIWYLSNKKSNVTCEEVTHTLLSVIFFCHSAVNFKTMKQVIMEIKSNSLSGYQPYLSRTERKTLHKSSRNTVKISDIVISGKEYVVKSLKKISSKYEFFRELSFLEKASKTRPTLFTRVEDFHLKKKEKLNSEFR